MRNFRKQTIFLCGFDGTPLILTKGKYGLFYRCPKYFHEHRGPKDCVCTNSFSLRDQENLFAELEWLEEEGKLKNGTTGRIGAVKYEITEVSDALIRLTIINIKVKPRKGRDETCSE